MAWLRRDRPDDPRPVEPVPEVDDSPDELRRRVAEMVALVNRSSGRLPTVAVVQARYLLDTLTSVIALSSARSD